MDDILALPSFILELRVALVATLVILSILSSITSILALHLICLTTLFFTTLLSLLKSTGIVSNFTISNLPTLFFKLLKLVGTFFNSPISNLLNSVFKLTRSDFAAHLDVSLPLTFLNLDFVAKLDKSIDKSLTSMSTPNGWYGLRKY